MQSWRWWNRTLFLGFEWTGPMPILDHSWAMCENFCDRVNNFHWAYFSYFPDYSKFPNFFVRIGHNIYNFIYWIGIQEYRSRVFTPLLIQGGKNSSSPTTFTNISKYASDGNSSPFVSWHFGDNIHIHSSTWKITAVYISPMMLACTGQNSQWEIVPWC